MVTGNEYIFPNIDDALEYVLKNRTKRQLASDRKRQVDSLCARTADFIFFEAWNEIKTDSGGQFKLSL